MRPFAAFAVTAALVAAPAAAGVPGQTGGGPSGSPVRTHPLGPDELLIEVGGIGVVTTRADLATITVSVQSSGDSPTAARRANDAKVRDLIAVARRAGAPADAIEARPADATTMVRVFDVREEPPPLPENQGPPPESPPPPEIVNSEGGAHQAASTITIRLRDIEKAAEVSAALRLAGAYDISDTIYSLTDATEARRTARAQALAMAQADAEAYAAQTNRRIARLVRLTDRIGFDIYGLVINNASLMQGMRAVQDPTTPQRRPDITTFIFLGADYALAPR